MRIVLKELKITANKAVVVVPFSNTVTFLYGPMGTGKSTVARLIDYCLGGRLQQVPAIQQEFVSAELSVQLGENECRIERGAEDSSAVRVSWMSAQGDLESLSVPLLAQDEAILDGPVHNLSDLLFFLAGVEPIRVRTRKRDSESPTVRLSFRDLWWYCYLDQAHLDSSFFRLEDIIVGRKSQDAMRFFTGLHSERLSELETQLARAFEDQRTKREAVEQIRRFMEQFEFGSEREMQIALTRLENRREALFVRRKSIDETRRSETHPSDPLRDKLRKLGDHLASVRVAIKEAGLALGEQKSLRAEFITSKTKAQRVGSASTMLAGVEYTRCPKCGVSVENREVDESHCCLCGLAQPEDQNRAEKTSSELEAVRLELNNRIDEVSEAIERRTIEIGRMRREESRLAARKDELDQQLQDELIRYDSAYMSDIRRIESSLARTVERISTYKKLIEMPRRIDQLEEEAGSLQGRIDVLKRSIDEERGRLKGADAIVAEIESEFMRIMLAVSFPGVEESDTVEIDTRKWRVSVSHGDQTWGFEDAGSGGKMVLFKVCYALALHIVGYRRSLPIPSLLIVDSPTKNISEDENPEVVHRLYEEIYRIVGQPENPGFQIVLIDSEIYRPEISLDGFVERRMAGVEEAPSLIPYYSGP